MDLGDLLWERRPYDRWQAYFQTKLANLLFTFELDRRLGPPGRRPAALAAHPGGSRTSLGHNGRRLDQPALPLWSLFCQSAASGPSASSGRPPTRRRRAASTTARSCRSGAAPIRERPSRQARDPQLAAGLWERSEALTGTRL